MVKAPRYSLKEAERIARRFFAYDYHDRGMMKWQGFFLSDHASALRREAKQQPELEQPQLTAEEIGRRLTVAWQKKYPVHLQLNVLDGNHTVQGLDGIVAGYDEAMLVLKTGRRYRRVPLDDLRWIGKLRKNSAGQAGG
ncbi:hypothetical protein [uncultured Limosilactobacillus sp.]|uniref:hypothetical protein n=1 Tax=uncultured Limosilactobacillus sp. TaxID=2837629 RepID=UPI0025D8DE74|nr:hypothetical protein [uncultured Limosilactobacillus sp.]